MIESMRTGLPEYGWTTLSIQLPVIAPENQVKNYGKTLDRVAERIKAAIRLLHEYNFRNIIAIGHSFGVATLLSYLEYAFVKPPINILDLN